MRNLPDDYIEKLIIKGMLEDSNYTATISSSFEKDYFDDNGVIAVWEYICDHFKNYNKLPDQEIIKQSIKQDIKEEVKELFVEINSIDYDISKNYDHLFSETNEYLKEKAFKDALMKGVDLVQAGQNPLEYKNIIEEALSKDLNTDLGVNYWNSLSERLKRVLSKRDIRVPSHFPKFDEFINGGFPTYTLSVILARVHGQKTNMITNMAARQVLRGYNPLIISLEMGEDAICQRFDSIYSGLNVNRIYMDKTTSNKMISSLKKTRENNGLGQLIVKQFPTGAATVQDFETLVRELNYRGIYPNPIYVDYLQLIRGIGKEQRYEQLKYISEGLRAMSLRFKAPVISVCQLNAAGTVTSFDELDWNVTAGSNIDIPATADFMCVFGKDEENLVYESEIHYKIIKNRLGGRIGEKGKIYFDKSSLKLYDESELDKWIKDADVSGDDRKPKQKK